MRIKPHQIGLASAAFWFASASTLPALTTPPEGFDLAVVSSPPAASTTVTLLDHPLSVSRNGRSITDDGRFVVFSSAASNLPGGNGVNSQTYLFDERTGLTTQLNAERDSGISDVWDVVISGNGLIIAETLSSPASAEQLTQIVLTDRTNGSQTALTQLLGKAVDSIPSWSPTLSADGRFLAFLSDATDLVPDDTNDVADLFVLDRELSALSRVSIATDGTQANMAPSSAQISDDGDVVSFVSPATNLIAEDTNTREDVFYHVRSTGVTTRLEVAQRDSTAAPYAVRNNAVLSGNGQYFAFVSSSDTLAEGIVSVINRVYRHDRLTNTTELASIIEPVSANINEQLNEAISPSISTDGQRIGFISLGEFAIRDFAENTLSIELDANSAVLTHNRSLQNLKMSADASAILLNTRLDFVGEFLPTGTRSFHYRVGDSLPTPIQGAPLETATADDESMTGGDGNVSGDGRFVVFSTRAVGYTQTDTFEQHVVLADMLNGTRLVITQGQTANGEKVLSGAAVVSDTGSHIAFESTANRFANMTEAADDDNGASDLFVYELATGNITHASKPHPTLRFTSRAYRNPDLSADGRYLSFNSSSSNILQNLGNERVYRLDRETGDVILISKTLDNIANDGRASEAKISANGQTIAFTTASPNLLSQTSIEPNQRVFLWRADTNEARQIVAPAPTPFFGPTIALSGNGRFIAYTVRASLDPTKQWDELWQYDALTDTAELIEEGELLFVGSLTDVTHPVMSHSGRYIGFRVTKRLIAQFPYIDSPASLYRIDRLEGSRIELNGNLSSLNDPTNRFGGGRRPTNLGMSADGRAIVFGDEDPLVGIDLNSVTDVFSVSETEPGGSIVSAILPSSRHALVNETTTAYATLISSTDMSGCKLRLADSADINFSWQLADLTTGSLLGTENTVFSLAANAPVALLLSLQAGTPVTSAELVVDAWCATGQAADTVVGLNTMEFSASTAATPDVVALTASIANDGTVNLPPDGRYGFFSIAAVNVGASDEITVIPAMANQLSGNALICQTNPANGACLLEPSASVTLQMAAEGTATFAVFVRADEAPAFHPALNRVSVSFLDSAGMSRGRTSLALR